MIIRLFASSSLLLTVSAEAQTTTRCSTVGTFTNCTSDQAAPTRPIDYQSRIAAPVVIMPRHRDGENGKAAKKAGKMVAAGDCSGAYSTALNAGDLDTAERVRRLCDKP